MKTYRTMKNSRVFSPKYYASLMNNTGKFKYHTSSETYINEYRKKKGYLLSTHKTSKVLPQLLPTQACDDEQLSTIETLNEKASGNDASEHQNDATTERTIISTSDRLTASTTDLSSRQNPLMKSTNSFADQPNIPPSIPSLTKAVNEASNMSNFSTVAFRNTQLRAMRHSNHHHHHHHSNQQHQTVILPPLNSSLQYLSSMNSLDRFYSHSNRKPSMQNHQKCFLIEGRNKKRLRLVRKITLTFKQPVVQC
ncbi:hypothetical protein I4U23_001686 [Adineta vaga]|nr:hypothetical protein I4U23_001686 [Adineta vaga]